MKALAKSYWPSAAAALFLLGVLPLDAEKLVLVPVEGDVSSVTIEGTSNVRDWDAHSSRIEGTVEVESADFWGEGGLAPERLFEKETTRLSGTVRVLASSLTSDSRRLTNNLHDYLEASSHRYIEFVLTSAELLLENGVMPAGEVDAFKTRVEGTLTVSGDSKKIAFPVDWRRQGHRVHLRGKTELNMSDFGIEPPTMMFGALRTVDEFTVEFEWVLMRKPPETP